MTSTLDPDNFSKSASIPKGHDVKSLGPSDSSDSGSDLAGRGTAEDEEALEGTSDRYGTGEGLSAGKESKIAKNADIEFDRVVDAADAGLGGGLDQAEEAQLGIRDEEIDESVENQRKTPRRK